MRDEGTTPRPLRRSLEELERRGSRMAAWCAVAFDYNSIYPGENRHVLHSDQSIRAGERAEDLRRCVCCVPDD